MSSLELCNVGLLKMRQIRELTGVAHKQEHQRVPQAKCERAALKTAPWTASNQCQLELASSAAGELSVRRAVLGVSEQSTGVCCSGSLIQQPERIEVELLHASGSRLAWHLWPKTEWAEFSTLEDIQHLVRPDIPAQLAAFNLSALQRWERKSQNRLAKPHRGRRWKPV